MTVLEVKNLQKSFGTIRAVQDISFSVKAGEVFTIIGPNGAGKTTTLEMIEGLVTPDQGDIHFGELNWNRDAVAIKKMIGVQPQSSAMFDLLTPEENLNLFATFYNHSRPTEDILQFNQPNRSSKQSRKEAYLVVNVNGLPLALR